MLLYKYLSSRLSQVLDNGMFRFSPPSVLNDPFELKPHIAAISTKENILSAFREIAEPQIIALKEQLSTIGIVGLTDEDLWNNFLNIMSPDFIVNQVNTSGPQVQKLLAEKFEQIGMLCLTEKKDNLLMWAHYAESHTGFVVGLDADHEFFDHRRSEQDELRHLVKVEYVNERPAVNLSELQSVDVFASKARIWEYEQEWRLFKSLADADDIKPVSDTEAPIHLFKFPLSSVKVIVLGARMPLATQEHMIAKIRSNPELSRVEILKSEINEKIFALDFTPVAYD